jgi:hypothetical protein
MKRELTSDERKQIFSRLLTEAQQGGDVGKFPRRTITAVAADFHVCKKLLRTFGHARKRITLTLRCVNTKHRLGKNAIAVERRSGIPKQ